MFFCPPYDEGARDGGKCWVPATTARVSVHESPRRVRSSPRKYIIRSPLKGRVGMTASIHKRQRSEVTESPTKQAHEGSGTERMNRSTEASELKAEGFAKTGRIPLDRQCMLSEWELFGT